MIGELPPAPGLEHRQQIGIQEVAILGRDAGRIERRMLEQPDQLARVAGGDGRRPSLHRLHRLGIADAARGDGPAGRCAVLTHQAVPIGARV